MLIADLRTHLKALSLLRGFNSLPRPLLVQWLRALRAVVASAAPAPRTISLVGEQRRQVEIAIKAHLLQQVDATNRRLEARQTELRQQPLQVASKLLEERHNMRGPAAELRTK